MSMKANILRDASGNIIVHMQGDLNYDHSDSLRNELQSIANQNTNARITIDIGGIDFVGSSGICHFVETVKYLKEGRKLNVALSNVKPEFLKIFRLYSDDVKKVIRTFNRIPTFVVFGLHLGYTF